MKELKGLKDFLEKVSQLTTSYEDIGVLIEMAYDENDESLVPEIEDVYKRQAILNVSFIWCVAVKCSI